MVFKPATLALLLTLTGCAHQLDLISRTNSGNGSGKAEEMGKKVTVFLKNKMYVGTYVYDGLKVITTTASSNTNSTATSTAISGKRIVTANGQGNSNTTAYATTYIPGSGNGSFVATSGDDTIRCDFNYKDGTGIGYCQNNSGEEYDLIIH